MPQYSRNVRGEGYTLGTHGAGGSLPTLWNTWKDDALTLAILGSGEEEGIPYVMLRVSGTMSNTNGVNLYVDDNCPVVQGGSATASGYVQITAGTRPTSFFLSAVVYNSTGGWLQDRRGEMAGDLTCPLASQRLVASVTATNAASARVGWSFVINGGAPARR